MPRPMQPCLDLQAQTSRRVACVRRGGWWRVLFAAAVLAFAAAAMLLAADVSMAQVIDTNVPVTNGPVYAVAYSGNTVYVGGAFTRLGPATGCGAPISVSSGSLPGSFPKVNGYVTAVAADGSGGWFIGGIFTTVGGLPRANLAHIASDLSVAAWNPAVGNQVNAIAVGGSVVYVGGQFNSAGGQVRNFAAAFDATTGSMTSWNPNSANTVDAIVASSTKIYVGGTFTSIGGQPRQHLAALDPSTGAASSWAPNPDDDVNALALGASSLYVGGSFLNIGGQARSRIAEIDLSSGLATSWNPGSTGSVVGLALGASTVYACGQFGTIGGQSRNYLAAIDRVSGSATSWNPHPDNMPWALLASGSVVYVGGFFSNFNGVARNNLAAIDATTGVPTSWDPNPNDQVKALALSGSNVYAGGFFTSFSGLVRNRLAAFNASTGAISSWNPSADDIVYSLALNGNTLYAGGYFSHIGPSTRDRIAGIDLTSGAATSFRASANGPVFALAVSGQTVYAGGSFTLIGNQFRNYLAALDLNGSASSWNPNPNALVDAIALIGTTVYVGGSFTSVGVSARNYVAAIDGSSGAPTSWNPGANSYVYALASSGSLVYAGGDFTTVGGLGRNYLAAIDGTSGVPTSWNPNVDGRVNTVLPSLTLVYIGGSFYNVNGTPHRGLAAIDAASGSPSSWTADPDGPVQCLALSDSLVYAGGGFIGLGPTPQFNVGGINADPEIISMTPAQAGNSGAVTVVLHGKAFRGGASTKLEKAEVAMVTGTQVQIAPKGDSLAATFDLTGQQTGQWQVTVLNRDLTSGSLDGFQVVPLAAPQLRVSIVGPDSIRASYPEAFDILVENPGNVDALAVPLWVTGIPSGVTATPAFILSPPPQAPGEPSWGAVPPTFAVASGQYLPMVIPRVPPGTMRRRLILNAPSNVPLIQMGAAIAPPWGNDPTFLGCLSSGGAIVNPSCAGSRLAAINAYLMANPQLEAMSGTGIWAKEGYECEGAVDLTTAIAKAQQALGVLDQAIEQGNVAAGCGDALLARWQQTLAIHVVFSIDPNDKLSPQGTVSSLQFIPYSIRFENLSTATASTRVVTVVDQLTTNLDLSTLSLDAIDLFGTVHLLPAPGSKQYTHDVDLGHDNLIVRVSVSLDTPSRQLVWSFATLDKTTLQPPSNPLLGFLPPNQSPPQGEGSVLFEIRPASSTPNGTAIQNGALISFDGVAQNTPPASNTLDNTAPSSNVMALNNPIPNQTFPVSWTATGSPTDLKDFTVYVAEDNGPYQTWKLNTISTSDTYVPHPGGHTYAFYSVARDLSGNIEAAPTSPDAQTLSTTAVGEPSGPFRLALAGARPNPARGILRVAFTLGSSDRATLELIDIAGRRVARREVGTMGPGRHELSFDVAPRLGAGLYFVRLTQAGQVLTTRVVLVR